MIRDNRVPSSELSVISLSAGYMIITHHHHYVRSAPEIVGEHIRHSMIFHATSVFCVSD